MDINRAPLSGEPGALTIQMKHTVITIAIINDFTGAWMKVFLPAASFQGDVAELWHGGHGLQLAGGDGQLLAQPAALGDLPVGGGAARVARGHRGAFLRPLLRPAALRLHPARQAASIPSPINEWRQ